MRKEKKNMADFFSKLGSKLGDNLGDLGKIISEKAEEVSKKTEDVVEIQKIKNQIRVMERNNERDFLDIGKMIYDQYKKGTAVDAEYAEICEAIADREASIAEYEEQVAELKGKDVCQNCKEHVDASAVYCPKCGTKVERKEEVVADVTEDDIVEVEEDDVFEEDEVEVVEVVDAEVVEE